MDIEVTETIISETVQSDAKKSPNPAKKLKQVRLPFKTLDPKSAIPVVTPDGNSPSGNQKKRRLSDKDSFHRASKSPRADNEQENKVVVDNVVRSNKKPLNKGTAILPKITDDEISSSCESEIRYLGEISKKSAKSENLLERFIQKGHQQVPEVSTSSTSLSENPNNDGNQSTFGDSKESVLSADSEKKNEIVNSICDVTNNESKSDTEMCLQSDLCEKEKDQFDDLEASAMSSNDKETDLDATATSIDLDSSLVEGSESLSLTPASSKSSKASSISSAKKQKRKEDRERLKQEKLKKQLDGKEEKQKQREVLKQQRDEEKAKAKAEKEQAKMKILEAKMEEKKKREDEKQKKEEERKKKEEKKEEERKRKDDERKRKEEEKKSRDDEKRLMEEEENKKKEKAKMAFASFFVKKELSSEVDQVVEPEGGQFKPFEVTKGMFMAPILRSEIADKTAFDNTIQLQTSKNLYLTMLKDSSYVAKKGSKTVTKLSLETEEKFDDDIEMIDEIDNDEAVMVVDDAETSEKVEIPHAKLIQFHENRRPPYWGTFRKKSEHIKPCKPFGKDKNLFDYEVDSDDEWEEEEPGESLHGSDDDKESEDDYDEDGEFMVPHGYLSADEEDEDPENDSPENQKQKLKLRAEEFEMDMKKSQRKHVKKPRIIGCIWLNSSDIESELVHNDRLKLLQCFGSIMLDDGPIATSFTKSMADQDANLSPTTAATLDDSKSKNGNLGKKAVPEEAMPHLIELLHGNVNSRPNIISEFQLFWKQQCTSKSSEDENGDEKLMKSAKSDMVLISKRQLAITINEISTWTRYPNPEIYNRLCWVVGNDILAKYNLVDLPIPNQWNYVSKNLSLRPAIGESPLPIVHTPKVNKITKFTRPMSPRVFETQKTSDEVKVIEPVPPVEVLPTPKTPGPMMKFFKPVVSSKSPESPKENKVQVLTYNNAKDLLKLIEKKQDDRVKESTDEKPSSS